MLDDFRCIDQVERIVRKRQRLRCDVGDEALEAPGAKFLDGHRRHVDPEHVVAALRQLRRIESGAATDVENAERPIRRDHGPHETLAAPLVFGAAAIMSIRYPLLQRRVAHVANSSRDRLRDAWSAPQSCLMPKRVVANYTHLAWIGANDRG